MGKQTNKYTQTSEDDNEEEDSEDSEKEEQPGSSCHTINSKQVTFIDWSPG